MHSKQQLCGSGTQLVTNSVFGFFERNKQRENLIMFVSSYSKVGILDLVQGMQCQTKQCVVNRSKWMASVKTHEWHAARCSMLGRSQAIWLVSSHDFAIASLPFFSSPVAMIPVLHLKHENEKGVQQYTCVQIGGVAPYSSSSSSATLATSSLT